MQVPMQLSRIFIREMTDMQIIELSEIGGDRAFPIVIGLPEAFAIERRLKGIEIPRPQTHDLLAGVIDALGAVLKRIEIHDMREGTFYARLVLERDGTEVQVDSRPSDAIAIGVAKGAPILVEESVLEQASSEAAAGASPMPDIGPEQEPDEEEEA